MLQSIEMKVSIYSGFSILIILLFCVSETVAWGFNFSFGNLMFAIGHCHLPGPKHGPLACKPNCNDKAWLRPDDVCDNACTTGNGEYVGLTTDACGNFDEYYQSECMAIAQSDCSSFNEETESEYYVADAYNEDESNVNLTGASSRNTFLPYIIAAVVATIFVGIYVYKKKYDEKERDREEALMEEENMNKSFHGSVAKRINEISSGKDVIPLKRSGTETSFVKTDGYTLA